MSETLKNITQAVLVTSLVLGAQNLSQCTKAAFYKPLTINWLQVGASFFQLLNQAFLYLFFILDSRNSFAGQCKLLQDMDFVAFFLFVALSTWVLISRTTILVDEKYQVYVKIFLGSILIVTLGAATHASIYRIVFIDPSNGRCGAIWYETSNTLKICCNFFIYLCCFGIFTASAFKHYFREIGNSKSSVKDILFSVAFRMVIAMFGFLVSAVFSLAGVWGMAFEIQFSFENYCAIVASSYSIKKDGTASAQQDTGAKRSTGVTSRTANKVKSTQ